MLDIATFLFRRVYQSESGYFPKVSATKCIVLLFSFCQPDKQEVVSQSYFNLLFFNYEWLWTFSHVWGPFIYLVFCEFSVYWAFIYCSSRVLCILGVLASCLWIDLPNILSEFVTCLWWFKIFYTMKKSLVLCDQVINILLPLHFGSWFRKLFPIPQLSLFPVVLLSSFIFCCYNPIYRLGNL